MPASRSRTELWREQMHRLYERNGALEISVRPASGQAEQGADVVWRVRMLALSDDAIVVEQPAVFGEGVDIRPGVELIGAMTVGQNRWMFHTRVLAVKPGPMATACAEDARTRERARDAASSSRRPNCACPPCSAGR